MPPTGERGEARRLADSQRHHPYPYPYPYPYRYSDLKSRMHACTHAHCCDQTKFISVVFAGCVRAHWRHRWKHNLTSPKGFHDLHDLDARFQIPVAIQPLLAIPSPAPNGHPSVDLPAALSNSVNDTHDCRCLFTPTVITLIARILAVVYPSSMHSPRHSTATRV
jgi:hypothetical protein